jgi:hypothetical protein
MAVAAAPPMGAPNPGNFSQNTRAKQIQMADIVRTTGGGPIDRQLPKVGLLAGLTLAIRGSITGTLTAPNALGLAAVIRRVRLQANAGIDIINVSGAGYHYLLREVIDSEYIDPIGQSNARSAVSNAAFNLDMYFPIMVNLRDPIGLLMLQHEGLTATLTVDFEADANLATGVTGVSCTVTPYLDIFTPPVDDVNMPDLTLVHRFLEDVQAVGAAGDFQYSWLRGTNYLKILHGLGIGAAGTDLFSRYALRVNQTDYIRNVDVKYLDNEFRRLRGRARPAGGIYMDMVATSGLGNYGAVRDAINSAQVTDMYSIITATGAGSLYTIREDILRIM